MSIDALIAQHLSRKIRHKIAISTGLFSAHRLLLDNGQSVFIKYQPEPSAQFAREAQALRTLNLNLPTPTVLAYDAHCLILEWIETAHNPTTQAKMGHYLAQLHQKTQPYFGFESDNFIGKTPQQNAPEQQISDWATFYWQYRLRPQIEQAYRHQQLNARDYQQLLRVENHLSHLLNDAIKPALLHGDLWSGNVIHAKNSPYFIDPACYYGHAEADLALTFMFGGFSSDFYTHYHAVHPRAIGFTARKPLYMLYHYLNHLNLFGSSYHAKTMHCYGRIIDASRAGQSQ